MRAVGIFITGTCLDDRRVAWCGSYVREKLSWPRVSISVQDQVRRALATVLLSLKDLFDRGIVKPWLRACSYFYEAQLRDTKSDPNNYIHRRLVMKITSNPTLL